MVLFILSAMSEAFVTKRVPDPAPIVPPLEEWQAVFFDCRGKLCPTLPTPQHAERYLDFLEHRIARQPTDLVAHVRRIMLARAYRQGKIVEGALRDLFRVLGDKGEGLRAHLLSLCTSLLDAQTVQGLRHPMRLAQATVTAIVSRSSGQEMSTRLAASGKAATLTEALSCLENGQVEEARSLLESHLKAFPDDVEATGVLLDIYLRARDQRAFESLRQQLEPLPEAVRMLWQATAASLAKRV